MAVLLHFFSLILNSSLEQKAEKKYNIFRGVY
jgi:hypothetical protein